MSGRHNGGGEPNKRGESRIVTMEQRRERLDLIEQLMVRGVGATKIEKACAEKFGMPRSTVLKYMERLREQWAEEERVTRPTNKATAQRRLYQHIQKAREADNWAAVASLERLLSDIQGTKEATEVNVNLEAMSREATLHVIANITPEMREKILGEQRRLRELAAKIDTSAMIPVVTPEEVLAPSESSEDE
jgi:DNA polymerase/3'-5' exonuclease PolX